MVSTQIVKICVVILEFISVDLGNCNQQDDEMCCRECVSAVNREVEEFGGIEIADVGGHEWVFMLNFVSQEGVERSALARVKEKA
jgi:hypothetical protein